MCAQQALYCSHGCFKASAALWDPRKRGGTQGLLRHRNGRAHITETQGSVSAALTLPGKQLSRPVIAASTHIYYQLPSSAGLIARLGLWHTRAEDTHCCIYDFWTRDNENERFSGLVKNETLHSTQFKV